MRHQKTNKNVDKSRFTILIMETDVILVHTIDALL